MTVERAELAVPSKRCMTAADDYPLVVNRNFGAAADQANAALTELDHLRARCAALETALADLLTGQTDTPWCQAWTQDAPIGHTCGNPHPCPQHPKETNA